jgi:signal transduction histidine kinase
MQNATVLAYDPDGGLSLAKLDVRFGLHAFQSAGDAISGLTHLHPDVVVARMDPSGIDLCRHVIQRDPVMPVILLSTNPSREDVLEGLRAGARDVVVVDGAWVGALQDRVEEAVKWHRLVEQDAEAQVQSFMVQTELYQQKAKAAASRVDDLQLQLRAEKALVTQSQQQLELQRELALAAVRAKGTFLANMTHELHTPLNAIINYAEMLREDLEPERRADADAIIGSGRQLLALLQDVLDLARLEAGEVHPIFEPVHVQQLVERVVADVSAAASRRGIRIDTAIDPSVVTVVSDPRRLQEALGHLLDNALKFGGDGAVRLEVAREADGVVFMVEDRGIGFEQEDLDRMLGVFTQVDEADRRGFGGVGMGLAIANQLARVLNGRLAATGSPGQGARFSVWLPEADDTAVEGHDRQAITVLVVDDDPVLRRVVQHMLVADGHRVVATANPEEAIELARAYQPSLIALDVLLPGTDGLTLLERFKDDPELRDIPIVMLSATSDEGRARTLGACDFLQKPVTRDRLQAIVRDHALPASLSLTVLGDGDTEGGLVQALRAAGMDVDRAHIDDGLGSLDGCDAILVPLHLPETAAHGALQLLVGVRDLPVFVVGDVPSDAERTFLENTFAGVLSGDTEAAGELRQLIRSE